MKKEIKRVYIEKPKNISDKELRKIFKEMKLKTKITKDQIQIHVTMWNENGIFNLGMKFKELLILKKISENN